MTVAELIEKLTEMPQDIEIKMYDHDSEDYMDIDVFHSSIMDFAEIEPADEDDEDEEDEEDEE